MRRTRVASFTLLALILACENNPSPASGVGASSPPAGTGLSAAAANDGSPMASSIASVVASVSVARANERQLYYDVAIGDAELSGRSLRELTLMRNTIYARAGNSFRKPWLDDYFKAQSFYVAKEKTDESKITPIDRENARKITEYDARLAKEELERRKDELLARRTTNTALADDSIEMALLSQRLGVWLGGPNDGAPSPLEDVAQLEKLVTLEQLAQLSRRDLRVLRNTIYARRGRVFESEVVRSYFKNAAWYRPSAQYGDHLLTEIDRKNIAIVRSVEASLGGPEHENIEYGKYGWFVMA